MKAGSFFYRKRNMSKNRVLDFFNIIDVEATCYERDQEPANFQSEVIEVGLCVVDLKKRELAEKHSFIVKPKLFPISAFCTNLTTLTQEDVNKGISFIEVCDILERRFQSKRRVWGSWGDYDRIQLDKQSCREGIKYPFGRTHINIKNLHAIKTMKDKEVGLGSACHEMLGGFDGTQHRGDDDAWNIGRVFLELLK